MATKTTFGRAKEAIIAARERGCTRDEIEAAMGGFNNIGAVPGGKAGREKAIAKIEALQPTVEITLPMKPLSKETIAALEIQTKTIIDLRTGQKKRVGLDRAKEGSERTVVVHVNADGVKTSYETIRDDLVKGFANAAKELQDFTGLEKRVISMNPALGAGYASVEKMLPLQRLPDNCGRKFLADGTRVFTSPPLPPAKPALPVQKVWPIGVGLLGTAYKEYDE